MGEKLNPKALHKISYGLYIVASKKEDNFSGQICNTVFQVTSEPAKIVISVNKLNFTHEFIRESNVFTASILSKDTPLKFIGHFGFKSGRDIDKFKEINYKIGRTGAPIVLDHAVAYIEAAVTKEIDAGTHTIFMGKVVDAEILTDEEPMTYAYYHITKRWKTPKTAPTYIKGEKQEEGDRMTKYRCVVCGYEYDPERGDPESGIKPGTPFEELPDNWVCPICGVTKDQFEKVE